MATPDETAACLEASRRAHAPYPRGEWRQLGHLYESEPAIEALIDHPSVLPKVRQSVLEAIAPFHRSDPAPGVRMPCAAWIVTARRDALASDS